MALYRQKHEGNIGIYGIFWQKKNVQGRGFLNSN